MKESQTIRQILQGPFIIPLVITRRERNRFVVTACQSSFTLVEQIRKGLSLKQRGFPKTLVHNICAWSIRRVVHYNNYIAEIR